MPFIWWLFFSQMGLFISKSELHRKREKQRDALHLLVYFPNSCATRKAKHKPGVSHVGAEDQPGLPTSPSAGSSGELELDGKRSSWDG